MCDPINREDFVSMFEIICALWLLSNLALYGDRTEMRIREPNTYEKDAILMRTDLVVLKSIKYDRIPTISE